jgi:hypothetical protein
MALKIFFRGFRGLKKPAFLACVLLFLFMCGCEKNNCQTLLQGSWYVTQPQDTTLGTDSLVFYKGDSIHEIYKLTADTGTYSYYSSYFVTDKCDEIDFNGTNTWENYSSTLKYQILQISATVFQFRSKADSSSCTACIVSMHR